jgi:hypothetical protein
VQRRHPGLGVIPLVDEVEHSAAEIESINPIVNQRRAAVGLEHRLRGRRGPARLGDPDPPVGENVLLGRWAASGPPADEGRWAVASG